MAAKEILRGGVSNLPKELTGTAAERVAYDITGLAVGSTYKEENTGKKFELGVSGWFELASGSLTITGGASELKQDTIIGLIDGVEGLLTQIRDAGPGGGTTGGATEAKQDTIIGHIDGLETLLTAVRDYVATTSTAAKQDTIIGHVDGLETLITAIKDTSGIKKITDELPAGTNNIGDVDILSADGSIVTIGAKADAAVTNPATTSSMISLLKGLLTQLQAAIPAGSNIIGNVGINGAIPSGTNNIGDVDVLTMPNVTLNALPSGTNNIGDVDVLSLPAIPAGTSIIGKFGIDQTTPGTTNGVQVNAALPAGNNNIGDVDVVTLPALSAGTNQVGKFGYTLKKVTTSFTRPADTTTYAVGDAVTNSTSAPVVFQLDLSTVGAVNGQSVELRRLSIVSSVKQSLLPLFNVYLTSTTFTATNDNSALDIADATVEAGGVWFTCDVQNYTASNSSVTKDNANAPMVLDAADTKFYGILQAANAYVPVSGEKFTIIAHVALL
jgi:hypothetical protein